MTFSEFIWSKRFDQLRVLSSQCEESGTLQRVKCRLKLTRYSCVVMLVYRVVGKLEVGAIWNFNMMCTQEL